MTPIHFLRIESLVLPRYPNNAYKGTGAQNPLGVTSYTDRFYNFSLAWEPDAMTFRPL